MKYLLLLVLFSSLVSATLDSSCVDVSSCVQMQEVTFPITVTYANNESGVTSAETASIYGDIVIYALLDLFYEDSTQVFYSRLDLPLPNIYGFGDLSFYGQGNYIQAFPKIWNYTIVWQEERNASLGWDLHIFDLWNNQDFFYTGPNGSNQIQADISGSLITWTDDRNGNADIYLYDLESDVETQVTNHSSNQFYPRFGKNNSFLFWEDTRISNNTLFTDIFYCDLDNCSFGNEIKLSSSQDLIEKRASSYGNSFFYLSGNASSVSPTFLASNQTTMINSSAVLSSFTDSSFEWLTWIGSDNVLLSPRNNIERIYEITNTLEQESNPQLHNDILIWNDNQIWVAHLKKLN